MIDLTFAGAVRPSLAGHLRCSSKRRCLRPGIRMSSRDTSFDDIRMPGLAQTLAAPGFGTVLVLEEERAACGTLLVRLAVTVLVAVAARLCGRPNRSGARAPASAAAPLRAGAADANAGGASQAVAADILVARLADAIVGFVLAHAVGTRVRGARVAVVALAVELAVRLGLQGLHQRNIHEAGGKGHRHDSQYKDAPGQYAAPPVFANI